jgi:uncharacterized alpha-E superfamily protein
MNEIYEILRDLCKRVSMEPERLAGELHAQLHYGRVEQIMTTGLHEYLMEFLEKLHTLNEELNSHFLTPADTAPPARTALQAQT